VTIPEYPVNSGPTPSAAKARVKNGWVSSCAQLAIFLFHCTVTGQVDHVFLDNRDTEWSGDQYAQQARYGQAGYGSAGGQQRSDDETGTTGTGGERPTVTSKVKGTSSLLWSCVGAR